MLLRDKVDPGSWARYPIIMCDNIITKVIIYN
jgi:hypothetical protein